MSIYKWESTVRDYEIDMQGIVNHAVYVNYLEVCRNNYARSLGIDIFHYHQLGYDLVIVDLNMQYKHSLRIQDRFYVTANLFRESKLRLNFEQEIRKNDETLVLTAKVTCVCIDNKSRKPILPTLLLEALNATVTNQQKG